jgi:hypothetical protein
MSNNTTPPRCKLDEDLRYHRVGDDEVRVAHALQVARVLPNDYLFRTIRAIAAQYPDMRMRAFIDACLLAQMMPIEIDDSI